MADNFTVNSTESVGDTFAADEISNVKYPRVKIQVGGNGSATDVSDGNPLPVDDAGGTLSVDDGGGTLTVDGTITASQATAANLKCQPQGPAAHDAACSGNPVLVGGEYNASYQSLDAGDVGNVALTPEGKVMVAAAAQTAVAYDDMTKCVVKRHMSTPASSGANTLLGAVAGKKFRVLSLAVFAASATSVNFYLYNGDNNVLGDGTDKLTVDKDGGDGPPSIILPWNPGGWFETDTANEALSINLSGATAVVVALTYIEVA